MKKPYNEPKVVTSDWPSIDLPVAFHQLQPEQNVVLSSVNFLFQSQFMCCDQALFNHVLTVMIVNKMCKYT